jgi:hypothetical protein
MFRSLENENAGGNVNGKLVQKNFFLKTIKKKKIR